MKKLFRIICVISLLCCSSCAFNSTEHTLQTKLDKNFQAYENTKDLLVKNIIDGTPTSRANLNTSLLPAAEFILNSKDYTVLKTRHQEIAATAQKYNRDKSIFNLTLLVNQPDLLELFIKELPKGAMLHNHPSGVRSMETVRKILERVNPTIDIQDDILQYASSPESSFLYPEEIRTIKQFPAKAPFSQYSDYQKNYFINLFALPQDGRPHPFPRFSTIFEIDDIFKNKENPELEKWVTATTYEDFIRRASNNNVSYVEFTKGFNYLEEIDQYEWWAKSWERKYKVTARWNMAFVRVIPPEKTLKYFGLFSEAFTKRPSPYLLGIDFLADETHAPALEKGQVLYIKAYLLNEQENVVLHRTMHAGELGLIQNPRDAILLRTERLGHGVKMIEDPLTLEYARTNKIPVVANITSNLQLGAAKSVSTHPFLFYLRLGIPVSLSTDDEGIFVTDITKDFLKAVKFTDINYFELKSLAYNGISSSFLPEDMKEKLSRDLDRRFRVFENKWQSIFNKLEQNKKTL